jgi:hypothetical protein
METLARSANRGSIATGAAYDIDNSLKLESDNSEKLYYTLSSSGDLQQMSFSCWVKRTELGSEQAIFTGRLGASGEFGRIIFSPSNTIQFWMRDSGSTTLVQLYTNRVFRDTSAWYHIVFGIDTTQATAADRVNLYINGVKETSFSSETYPTLNANLNGGFNRSTFNHVLGVEEANNTYFNGYITEAHFVDGQQLAAADFGEFDTDTGIWKPKAYTGSYGTNGFYLDFENSASLGADGSGNSNNFTLSNITSADQATDTPTNNFCTLNILDQEFDGTNIITDGATNVRIAGSGSGALRGTYAVSQGKWYWEMKITPINTSSFYGVWGIYTADKSLTGYPGSTTGSWGIYGGNGNAYYNGSSTTFYTDSIASGDIFSYAFNADDGQLFVYKNGSIIGANSGDLIATSGTSFPADFTYYSPTFADGTNSPEPSGLLSRFEVNFGGFTNFSIASGNTDENGYGNFEYAPPSGYYALCSKNLAEFG